MILSLPDTPARWPFWSVYVSWFWDQWTIGYVRVYYDGMNHAVACGPLSVGWMTGAGPEEVL